MQIWRPQIGEGVAAWVVVIEVLADPCAKVEYRVVTDDSRIGWRDVERSNLGPLVCIADVGEDWIRACPSAHHVLHIQVVESIWSLEPGAAVIEVRGGGNRFGVKL